MLEYGSEELGMGGEVQVKPKELRIQNSFGQGFSMCQYPKYDGSFHPHYSYHRFPSYSWMTLFAVAPVVTVAPVATAVPVAMVDDLRKTSLMVFTLIYTVNRTPPKPATIRNTL